MKRTIICTLLTLALLLASATAADAQEQALAGSALERLSQPFGGGEKNRDSSPGSYALGADELASIPAIVGPRECTETQGAGSEEQEYAYTSDSVRDDLLAYIDYLGENGFEVVRGAPLGEPGEGELSAASKDAGRMIIVRLDWTLDSYRIRITKSGVQGGQSAVDGNVEPDPAVMERGYAFIDEREYGQALSVFDAALAEHPNVAEYHNGRGLALLSNGQAKEARSAYDAAIALDPGDWRFYCNRGLAQYLCADPAQSLADLEKAVDLNPDTDDAHYYLADIQIDIGAPEDAVLTCALGISDFPDSDNLWRLLGDAQFALGHYSEALVAYDKAISFGYSPEDIPDYAEVKQRVGGSSDLVVQPPLPGETSGLKNYEDWLRPYVEVMPFQRSILDTFIHSVDVGDGWVEEAIAYPREWPAQWLDGAIPVYTGTGWMFDVFVVHPKMSYAAKNVRHVAITVYEYLPEEVDAYIAGLKASGFMEMQESQYDGDWVDSAREFRGEGCILNIVFAHGEGTDFKILSSHEDPEALQPFAQFIVDFTQEAYVPDLGITKNTELMNYNQFSDYMGGAPADRRSELDVLTDSFTDEYGRLYETIYYPSKWPKDVFGELIPEYRSSGLMYYMEITTPAVNPNRDQTLIVSMYIAPGSVEDVKQYAKEFAAFGYREVPQEEYTEQEALNSADNEAYYIFSLPCMRCYMALYDDAGMSMLAITLRFDGRYNNFFGQ